MKRLTWFLLFASLAVNATLIAALIRHRPESATNASDRTATPTARAGSHDAKETAPIVAAAAPSVATSRTVWERIFSRDPADFEAKLRAAGFSVGARRGAIYALLRDLQTPERTRAVESVPVAPYWQAAPNPASSSEYAREINRLWHERDRIMRRLFPEEQRAFVLRAQARYGPLPEDKLEKLSVLERDYGEIRMQVSQSQQGLIRMPWHAEQIAFLEQEKRKDIAALLTRGEMEDYELRNSPTAMSLQRQLAAFDPTEQEYRDLFRLRAANDEKLQATGGLYPSATDASNSKRQLADQIRGVLGEARFAAYERATDTGVVSAASIAQRLSLPAATADSVYQLQREMRERGTAIESNAAQTRQERDAQLAALAAEARQKLSALLTPDGVDQYRLETGDRSLPILTRAAAPRR